MDGHKLCMYFIMIMLKKSLFVKILILFNTSEICFTRAHYYNVYKEYSCLLWICISGIYFNILISIPHMTKNFTYSIYKSRIQAGIYTVENLID